MVNLNLKLDDIMNLNTNLKLSHYSEIYDNIFKGFTLEELKAKLRKKSECKEILKTKTYNLSEM